MNEDHITATANLEAPQPEYVFYADPLTINVQQLVYAINLLGIRINAGTLNSLPSSVRNHFIQVA